MRTIWDLLRYMKKTKPVRIHNAKVVVKETLNGNEYDITDLGISEYFRKRGNVEFELNGVAHKGSACYVTLKVRDKSQVKEVIASGLEYEKSEDDEKVFSRAVTKAVINGMRSLIAPEIKQALIRRYIEQGEIVRIPLETDKVKVFRPKLRACFSGRVS